MSRAPYILRPADSTLSFLQVFQSVMLNALPALFLALLPLAYAQDNDTSAVLQDLVNAKIIPNVVPKFTPAFPLDVVFTDNSGSKFPVTAGANLTMSRACPLKQSSVLLTFSCRDRQPSVVCYQIEQYPNYRKTIPHGHR
jgi:hypothetical protein